MSRTRKLAVLWIAFLMVLLPGAFLWMLLGTSMGLRWTLERAAGAMPEARIAYQRAEGSLWRGASVHGLSLASPDLDLRLARLEIAAEPARLLRREARFLRVDLHDLRIDLKSAESAPAPASPFPLALPALDLPVRVELESLGVHRLDMLADGEPLLEAARIELAAALAGGRLTLRRVDLEAARGSLSLGGEVDTRRRYRSRLTLDLRPAAPGWATRFELDGDLGALRLRSAGPEALPLALDLEVRALDRGSPEWRLDLRGSRLDPAPLVEGWAHGPLDIELAAEGGLERASLGGELGVAGRRIEIETLELALREDWIDIRRFAVNEGAQSLAARGEISRGAPWRGRLEADFAGLALPPEAPRARADGRIVAAGTLADWTLALGADVLSEGQASRLDLEGRGSETAFELTHLRAATDLGVLTAEGRVGWAGEPTWSVFARAERFDPSRLGLPLAGLLDARLASEGRVDPEQGPSGWVELGELGGRLGEAELGGRARVDAESLARWRGEADLRFGAGWLRGSGGARDGAIAAELRFAAIDPAALGLPLSLSAAGTLRAEGSAETPRLDLDLEVERVRSGAIRVERLQARGRLDPERTAALELSAERLSHGELVLDRVEAGVEGRVAAHRIHVRAAGPPLALQLEAEGAIDSGWRGRIDSLEAEVRHAGTWRLAEPVALAAGEPGLELGRACLERSEASGSAAASGGRLCLKADWPADGEALAELELCALSLALFSPLVFPDGFRRMDGLIEGRAELRGRKDAYRGVAAIEVPVLTLFLDPAGDDESFLRINDLVLDARLDPGALEATLAAIPGDAGRLEGRLSAREAGEDWALEGRLALDMDAAGLDTLVPDLEGMRGRIEAGVDLAGSTGSPRLDARLALVDFAADLPAAGIRLGEGRISARSEDVSRVALSGAVSSGQGRVRLDGHYDLAEARLQLRLEGEDFEAVNLPQVRAEVSPRLSFTLQGGAARLAGSVAVPRARIDVSRFEGADRPSADVIILEGDVEPEPESRLPLTARVTVSLGEDVRLRGFGLDGRLGGALTVRETPGQATTGQGAIEVSGRFAAYGRELDIQRGRLLFSGALDNPVLDVRAERAIEEVTVGVQVTGEATAPQLTLYSRPVMAQSDILAYLVVGRPMAQVRSGEGQMLSDAATALGTAGGDLLARQLGARMGLDLGVEASSELGTALTVGKFLSPRLYLGYGVSLFGAGQAIILRYLISRLWSAEVESGAEIKASLNYRLER